ncbi:TonB-dependent siderophore receptor [Aquabacterium lacunae]|uniref:TonB-dependent siderophore receptor n=1 Tax=Aquabacterium lacunae TaxID=2528630 RepID=A0A4Q9H4A1_9BURK|nr:TonB-dependent receptor [Aquabacterium lacunae]TBO30291.1 TonB-dependent siderophore receptor [Aquabacterium lacunae]
MSSRRRAQRSRVAQPVLPLGAVAAGLGLSLAVMPVLAQETVPTETAAQALPDVKVKAKADPTPEAKKTYQATTSRIGKGNQAIRDIPQSMTVMTEKLMDDRNLDDFRDILRATAGVTFLAGETGEEDVRLRGFSLTQAGDVYVDGIRDASLYERDTFNNDRVEVLKGSASMLFGRGSTGGVVNQVSKQPFLMTQHDVEVTVGTADKKRVTGDFNFKTGDSAAFRLNVMAEDTANEGARVLKNGVAPTFRWGIGTADEFSIGFYALSYDNRPNYNHPWFLVNGEIVPKLKADAYYGLESDYNQGSAHYATLGHVHRFGDGAELKTTLRSGRYERDIWASVIRYGTTNGATTTLGNLSDSTVLSRTAKGRRSITDSTSLQTDYTDKFQWLGMRHHLTAGLDLQYDEALRANNFPGTGTRPTTTVGTPNDGATIADTRGATPYNSFNSRTASAYAQDMVELTPEVKLIAGLRHDNFNASYHTTTNTRFSRHDRLWSSRFGTLFQPNDWASYHVSYGTSYNTSGDAYQFAVQGPTGRVANTPAEKSRNLEVGGKFDLLDGLMNLGVSLFHTEKYHERNTDPDSAATMELLSGKRHAAGVDVDVAGRITSHWDAFASWTWIPEARIDESNVTTGNSPRKGDRPGLTPKHSGSVWTTYRLTPEWRVGGGLTHRSKQTPLTSRVVTAKAFTTLDLMAEYTISERYSVKLNVKNATNELYADSLYGGFYAPGAARSAELTLKARF